jgi:hypothetical protein
MKAVIAVLIIVAAIFLGWKLLDYWDQTTQEREAKRQAASVQVNPKTLAGLPYQLEGPLDEAYKKGAAGLKEWLEKVKGSPQVQDPRLALVELDYVTLIYRKDPIEAKRVFAEVKQRISPESPVYPRIKAMEKTLE